MSWYSQEASGASISYLKPEDYTFINGVIAEYKKVPSNPAQLTTEAVAREREKYLNYFYEKIDAHRRFIESTYSRFTLYSSGQVTSQYYELMYPVRFAGMKQFLFQNLSDDDKLLRKENLDRYERGYESPKVFGFIPLNTITDAFETAVKVAVVAGAAYAVYSVGSAIASTYFTNQAKDTLEDELAKEASNSLSSTLTDAAKTVVTSGLVGEASKQLCAQGSDPKVCNTLSQIASGYLKTPEGTDWADYLADQAIKQGTAELLLQAFPQNSPERQALQRRLMQTNVATSTSSNKNMAKYALIGGGALVFLLGALS